MKYNIQLQTTRLPDYQTSRLSNFQTLKLTLTSFRMASCTYDRKGQGALRRRKNIVKTQYRKTNAIKAKTKAKVKMTTKANRIKKIKFQTAATQDDMTTRDSDVVVGDVIMELCRECKDLSADAFNPEPLPSLDPHAVKSARRLGLNKVAEGIVSSWSLNQWEKTHRSKCPYGHYDDDDGSEDFLAGELALYKSSGPVKEDNGDWGIYY